MWVRRFRCDNAACVPRTFTETFGELLGWRRRFTAVVQAILSDVAADPRKRRWLLLRPPEQLDAEERAALALLLARDAELAKAHNLAQRFRALLQARDLDGFRAWLAEAQASELPSFVGTANGMLADRAAVEAA